MGIFDDDDDRSSKRSLGERDKQILFYNRAKKRCENPACNKEIEYKDMEVGHKTAWSKGGRTTLKNSVCLCHTCNKLQGTDSWATFLKKQKVQDKDAILKGGLDSLSISQLKSLAAKHYIKVKGSMSAGGLFEDDTRKAPTKRQYISKLKGAVTEEEINSLRNATPQPKKKRKVRRERGIFGW